jgi:hypothetical protein
VNALKSFIQRCALMASSSVGSTIVQFGTPLFFTWALQNSAKGEELTAYNNAFSIFALFAIPAYAMNAIGSGLVAKELKENPEKIGRLLKTLFKCSALLVATPGAILFVMSKYIAESVYKIPGNLDYFLKFFSVSILLLAGTIPFVCVLNAYEKQKKFLYFEGFTAGCVCIPGFFYLVTRGEIFYGTLFGVVLNQLLISASAGYLAFSSLNRRIKPIL